MLKYVIACLMILIAGTVQAEPVAIISAPVETAQAAPEKEVLIFSKDHCPYCEQLKTDLNDSLIAAYPNVQFTVLNIKDDDAVDKLRQLARQHKIKSVGLPLLFVGDTYLMGWGEDSAAELGALLK